MSVLEGSPSAAIERLKAETEANTNKPMRIPRSVSLAVLHVEPLVFQVRSDGLDLDRVEEIAKGLQGSNLDDPLHIWWSGLRWIIVEGHHRHAAYQLKAERDGVTLNVPVEAHVDISLFDAMGAATVLNDRDKVSISKAEKLDMAWTMVCMQGRSIAQTAKSSGISESQISKMRQVLAKLKTMKIGTSHMIDHGWVKCREWALGKTHRDFNSDALEGMAQEMAEELKKLKVTSAIKSPDVFARAIEILSHELPSRLLASEPFWDALGTTGREMLMEIDRDEVEGNDLGASLPEDF
jgi:hypothetical protein